MPQVSHDDCVDWRAAVQNARIVTVRTVRGGHLGWHEGVWPLGPSWAVSIATDYVSAVLEQTAQTGWLIAVFDALDREKHGHSGEPAPLPLASRIAHAAASRDLVMPAPAPPPESTLSSFTPDLSTVHTLFFDDQEKDALPPDQTLGRDSARKDEDGDQDQTLREANDAAPNFSSEDAHSPPNFHHTQMDLRPRSFDECSLEDLDDALDDGLDDDEEDEDNSVF